MPLQAVATDTFTGADGSTPDAQWTVATGTPRIFSNGLRGEPVSGGDSRIVHTGTFQTDQYSEVTIATLPSSDELTPMVRCTGTDGYGGAYDGLTTVTVFKVVSGTYTAIGTRNPPACYVSDRLRIEVSGTGASTALRFYRNGVQFGADVSVSTTFNDSGKPGLNLWRATAGSTTARADALEVGNIVGNGTNGGPSSWLRF